MLFRQFRKLPFVFAAIFLVACNDEGPEINNGNFLDSAVNGLIYRTSSVEGITNSDGLFQYEDGETVTFTLGDIALPSARAKSVMTPLDLANTTDVNDPVANNIARLLQSVDQDDNPDNGITITLETRNAADGLSVSDWSDTTQFEADIADLTSALAITLITAEAAADHLSDTIDGLSGEESTVQLASVSDSQFESLSTARLLSTLAGDLYLGPTETDEPLVLMQSGEPEDTIFDVVDTYELPKAIVHNEVLYFLYQQSDGRFNLANLSLPLMMNEGLLQTPGSVNEELPKRYIPGALSPTSQPLLVFYDGAEGLVRVLEIQ